MGACFNNNTNLARIQVFRKGGSTKWVPVSITIPIWRGSRFLGKGVRRSGATEGSAPIGGPGASSPCSSLQKRDFHHSEASQRVLISHFLKVKNPFFFIKNITSYIKTCRFSLIEL